jgi:uncharacterized Zn-finger protein
MANYQCETCQYVFTLKSNLQRHIKTVHEKLKPFQCEICKKTFGHRQNFLDHIKFVHDKIKNVTCNKCGKGFTNLKVLKAHMSAGWPLCKGFSIKIACEFDLALLRLAVVSRWLLFRGGRKHTFDCTPIIMS